MENPSKLSISSSRRLNHHVQALAEMSLVRTWIVMWIVDLGLWIVYVDLEVPLSLRSYDAECGKGEVF